MNVLMVGGAFDDVGGRASGYFRKLSDAIERQLAQYHVKVVNGGSYVDLVALLGYRATHIVWMADVPNTYDKVLSTVLKKNPGALLVQSKSNIGGRYTKAELYARMVISGAELLVEFDREPDGSVVAEVLSISEMPMWHRETHIGWVARIITDEFRRIEGLLHPFGNGEYDLVPLGEHAGAFGVVRKNHIHEGIDLYGMPGQEVYAMEYGEVVGVHQFTGEGVGSPWWNDTHCVLLECESGVINYGEISTDLLPGDVVWPGGLIGRLVTVLKEDKGLPMTMLHLERYVLGTTRHIDSWALDTGRPVGLLDPTVLLKGLTG